MNEPGTNPLEAALARAATDPAARPEFYRLLLDSEVLVLGHMDGQQGVKTVEAGAKLSIATWQKEDGAPMIPFFSSLSALQRAIREEQSFLQLPSRALFETTRGANLVLNPSGPHGKEFFAEEIDSLLTSGMNQVAQTRIVEKPTQVLLGQPVDYPTAMVEALSRLFARHAGVKAAYVCLMHDAESQEKPHLVVGIQCDTGFEAALREAGVVAADTAAQGEPVDIVRVEKTDSGLSDYFLTTKPFYTRSWRTKFGSVFGAG